MTRLTNSDGRAEDGTHTGQLVKRCTSTKAMMATLTNAGSLLHLHFNLCESISCKAPVSLSKVRQTAHEAAHHESVADLLQGQRQTRTNC